MVIKKISTANYVTKSKLPAADFVINPYTGCLHACKYCYASFMKRFTNHPEPWGSFIDVKVCNTPINIKALQGKSVCIGSVTDAYNPAEKQECITRGILQQLIPANCEISILTKNSLVLRDIDLLKQLKNVTVSFSINTVNETFRQDMDAASPIAERINALKELHDAGIKTACFISPLFPELSEWKQIVEQCKDYVSEFWFENLNLRGDYKYTILNYIKEKHPHLSPLYRDIYVNGNKNYWHKVAMEIDAFCKQSNVNYKNYFHHEEIRK